MCVGGGISFIHMHPGSSRNTAFGRLAFSHDGGANWVYAAENAYNGSVEWTDGTNVSLYRWVSQSTRRMSCFFSTPSFRLRSLQCVSRVQFVHFVLFCFRFSSVNLFFVSVFV